MTADRWLWLRNGDCGSGHVRPANDWWLYTEWIPQQKVFRIRRTRWTYGGRLGIGIKPARIWLHVDCRRNIGKYE